MAGRVGEIAHHVAVGQVSGPGVDAQGGTDGAARAVRPDDEPGGDDHRALVADLRKWADGAFDVPDFLDSLLAFQPAAGRADGLQHVVVFPMYTQNGNPDRNLEAVALRMVWPEWLAELERTAVAAGRKRMVLETGAKQPEAIALYRSSGYEDMPGFGVYAGDELSLCLSKPL